MSGKLCANRVNANRHRQVIHIKLLCTKVSQQSRTLKISMGICAVRVNFVAAIIIVRIYVYYGSKGIETHCILYFIPLREIYEHYLISKIDMNT